jgi:TRAP transporter 4TM/12TM fusion protein
VSEIAKAPAELRSSSRRRTPGARKPAGFAATVHLRGLRSRGRCSSSGTPRRCRSPLRFGVLNDTEARSLHLAFALFLAFLAWPAFKRSPRDRVPQLDWVLAFAGAFAAAYLLLFYRELATRPGQPTATDIVVATTGIVLLARGDAAQRRLADGGARRAVHRLQHGRALPARSPRAQGRVAQPPAVAHVADDRGRVRIALGVSTGTIFVYVLFGTLLDRAGGGNYMMQVSFAALGHLRGGPAKVSVVSSALNGMISGSSVSNVVSGGIFTIPLMKKAGYGGVKAGAIETMSSVDGQIMPPVMGAAAFLMVEYVGIPYSEIVRKRDPAGDAQLHRACSTSCTSRR